MRYVSLDLETSGSDPLRHQVLELAAVVEDTRRTASTPLGELPSFRRALRHPEITGTAGALALNARLLEELSDKTKADAPDICGPAEVLPQLREFLLANGFKLDPKNRVSFTIAGKNIGVFDIPFLRQLPGWGTIIRAEPAVLDPASFYLNWHKDSRLPSMLICQARSGMPEPHVAHEALADALEVVRLLRPFYERPFYKDVVGEGH
jgi:oligoribonuclease